MSDKQVDDLTHKNLAKRTFLLRQNLIETLQDRVAHDTLTKISSRNKLMSKLGEIEKQDSVASVLFMDIDHFKRVNDEFDHATGDELLQALTDRLKKHVKEKDMLGRWGGEEFIMILDGLSDEKVLKRRAEDIRAAIDENPFHLSKISLKKTISIGAAVKLENEKWADWLNRADHAMYQAKESGRNRVVVAE